MSKLPDGAAYAQRPYGVWVRVKHVNDTPPGGGRDGTHDVFVGYFDVAQDAIDATTRISNEVSGGYTGFTRENGHGWLVDSPYSLEDLAARGDRPEVLRAVAVWHHRAGRLPADIARACGLSLEEIDSLLAKPENAYDHGLISTEELALHYGITEASARKLMSDHNIRTVSGYPRWPALMIPRGQGKRTDLL